MSGTIGRITVPTVINSGQAFPLMLNSQLPCAKPPLRPRFNSLPGVTPVRKFTDRNAAIRRIWARIHLLDRV